MVTMIIKYGKLVANRSRSFKYAVQYRNNREKLIEQTPTTKRMTSAERSPTVSQNRLKRYQTRIGQIFLGPENPL